MKERRLGLIIYEGMKVAYYPEGNEEMRDRAIRIAFKHIMGNCRNKDIELSRARRAVEDDWVLVIE